MAFPHQTPNDLKQAHALQNPQHLTSTYLSSQKKKEKSNHLSFAIANSYGLRLDGTTKLELGRCF